MPAGVVTVRCTCGFLAWGRSCEFAMPTAPLRAGWTRSKTPDVLPLDDWGMAAMDSQTRADLLEIIDDRASQRATIITSQLPIEHWHEWIGDQTMADAMLDRLMQNHHRFTLTGESLRKKSPPEKGKPGN